MILIHLEQKNNITTLCHNFFNEIALDDKVAAIAIDSTGLKRFGRDEWHQEKHKVSAKRSWRKLHIAVDQDHYIQSSLLTDRFVTDEGALDSLLDQVNTDAENVSLDGAYDSNNIYQKLSDKFENANIVIPPDKNSVISDSSHPVRTAHLTTIKNHGECIGRESTTMGKEIIVNYPFSVTNVYWVIKCMVEKCAVKNRSR